MSKFNFIYAEDLSHREKTVYIYLRDRADASGVCWPGIKTIAGELGLSPRTVQRALADLEHRQLIEKQQRHRANGSLTSNLYRLTAAKSHSLPPRGDCDFFSPKILSIGWRHHGASRRTYSIGGYTSTEKEQELYSVSSHSIL